MGAEGKGVKVEELFEAGGLMRILRLGQASETIARLLEQNGRDVLEARTDGSSLLHSFSLLGRYDLVKLLWDKGALPSIVKADSSSLLHSTVRASDAEQDHARARILKLFLSEAGGRSNAMPVNLRNSKGWTALKLAARKHLERCVEMLIEYGADPDIQDDEQYLALHNAVGSKAVLKLLLTRASNINGQTKDQESPLFLAVERGITDSALTLLEHGADPNIVNKDGISPLFLASRAGNFELVKALVKKGAVVNQPGAAQGITPLHWAAHKEHAGICQFLIEHSADILCKDREGRTPLSMASPDLAARMIDLAKCKNPDVVLAAQRKLVSGSEKAVTACCGGNVPALKALIQAGVSVNHTTGNSSATLLHMAAYCGQPMVMAYLLQAGADYKIRDKDGDTVVHFACMKATAQGSHDSAMEILLSSPASSLIDCQNCRGDTPLLVAARCNFASRVKLLLCHKADASITNAKGELPLHRACYSDSNMRSVMTLAEVTPDINAQDKDGWTALMCASKSQSCLVVHYLLQRSACPAVQQSAGFTALHLAVQENAPDVCDLLLRYGADPSIRGGPQCMTPLHIAVMKNMVAVITILVRHGADPAVQDADGDTPLSLADSDELRRVLSLADPSRSPAHPSTNPCNMISNSFSKSPSDQRSLWSFSRNPLQKASSKEGESDAAEIQHLQEEVARLNHVVHLSCSELKDLRSKHEMLQSRNQSLQQELDQRDLASRMADLDVTDVPSSHCWFVPADQFLVEEDQHINSCSNLPWRFYNVYSGTYRTLQIAAKSIRSCKDWGPEVFKTALSDIDTLSKLCSPHLVQFLGAYVDQSLHQCVLLMENMPNGNLYDAFYKHHLFPNPLCKARIMLDIASGMCYLHSIPFIHRNLVMRNILLGPKLNAKISDFGMYETKIQSHYLANIRQLCTTVSCDRLPVHKPPEVVQRNEYLPAGDVYAYAMLSYEFFTGKRPFSDMDFGSPCALVMRVLMGMRPEIPSCFPDDCRNVMQRSWHKDPQERPTFPEILEHTLHKIKFMEEEELKEKESNDGDT